MAEDTDSKTRPTSPRLRAPSDLGFLPCGRAEMAERVMIDWRALMDEPDILTESFAKFTRMEEEAEEMRMKMKLSEGSEEAEEKPIEGSEEEEEEPSAGSEEAEKPTAGSEGEGEEMDFEKAVEMRVRKRCDLHMDEEEAMRKVKKIAMGVQKAVLDERIDANEVMRKEKIDAEAMRAFLNLDHVLKGSQRIANPVKDALHEACRWIAEEIVKNSDRVMAEASVEKSSDSKVDKLLARSNIICDSKGKALAFPEERAMVEPKGDANRAKEMEEPKDDDNAARAKDQREKSLSDYNARNARQYPECWTEMFSRYYGSYEDTTSIPAMRFTDSGRRDYVGTHETLQIFSVKVTGIKEGLQWPLDIYGMVAIRDVVDHNRNIIFDCKRDNCQTITEKDLYLTLTGPSCAVLLSEQLTVLEVGLYLKGGTEFNDREFSMLITSYRHFAPRFSIMRDRHVPSNLSTLEITVGYIIRSVEATISVEVTHGSSWPDGYRGEFIASTASIDDGEISLLAFGEDKLPTSDDDKNIKLSRRVVSVEHPDYEGQLKVTARAVRGVKKDVLRGELVFTPQEAGKSQQNLKVGSCEMVITVAWSLLSSWP